VSSWSYCKDKLAVLGDIEEDDSSICVMPDEIPSTADMCERGIFGGLSSIFFRNRRTGGVLGRGCPFIGNDLRNLPGVLRQNLFSCILAHDGDEEDPVRSDIYELKRRISMMRMKHQADERGLLANPDIPWQLEAREHYMNHHQPTATSQGDVKQEYLPEYGAPVDLIPESPSDWLPYDTEMTSKPLCCSLHINLEDYEDFYRRYYTPPANPRANGTGIAEATPLTAGCPQGNKRKLDSQDDNESAKLEAHEDEPTEPPSSENGAAVTPEESDLSPPVSRSSSDEDEGAKTLDRSSHAVNVLHDTVVLLKHSGNKAFQAGFSSLAARRYDQAIQYCAVIFMKFPHGDVDMFATRRSSDPRLEWTPFYKLLITTRLNLSMVMLKIPDPEPRKAVALAMAALVELGPFVAEKGEIRKGRKFSEVYKDDEPESTYLETKELQAKAFFRLGSAQHAAHAYSEAVKSFENSVTSTTCVGGKPESMVLRRLEEAKRASRRKAMRLRKKLKAAFGDDVEAS
jgi:hypothetical protein